MRPVNWSVSSEMVVAAASVQALLGLAYVDVLSARLNLHEGAHESDS